MNPKRLINAALYPPLWVMIVLIPALAVLVPCFTLFFGAESIWSIVCYVLAAYTLTVCCLRIPRLVRSFKNFKSENKYARRWLEDEHLRVSVSLYGSLAWNVAYAFLQLWLGLYHHTFWYYSLAVYYVLLATMRFFLLRHTRMHRAGEDIRSELIRYRFCGWLLLVMNLALSVIVFFMIYWNRTFLHAEITTIMMATYTFTTFTVAIVNIVNTANTAVRYIRLQRQSVSPPPAYPC